MEYSFVLSIFFLLKVDSKEDNTEENDTVDENNRCLGDSDSDDDESFKNLSFDPTELYKQIFDYLQPGETVSKALCRLGKLFTMYFST